VVAYTHELSNSRPVISVITAAYNAEPYLPACIESVLNQTERRLELLVVDDGSSDATSEIVAQYAARDARVRGFRGPNRGASHARNVAMRHARGQFFALLDSDDIWGSTFAAEQLRLLRANPELAIVSGNGWNLGGGALDGHPVRPWPAEPRTVRFIDLVEHVDAMFIMSVFRREVYDTIGGFNETLYRSEDYEYWLRAAASGFLIQTNPRPLARYRRRGDSVSADQPAMFESIIRVLESAREFRQRPRAEELGAIDRQLGRLRAGRLLTLGKAALLRRDFVEARTHFRELYRQGLGLRYGAMAAALRLAPALVCSAYQHRLELLARRAGQTG
jgi:glycosyltransferase involved in cell wall biosynthesis